MKLKRVVRIVAQLIAIIHAGNTVVWRAMKTRAVVPALAAARVHVAKIAIKAVYKLVQAHVVIIATALVLFLV